MTKIRRLLTVGALAVAALLMSACDAGSSAPAALPDVTCYPNKAGGIDCPGYVFPAWITQECYVQGYDVYQCLEYAALFGYHLPR